MRLPQPLAPSAPWRWREGEPIGTRPRSLPEETAVALTYGRATYAVMMATPDDLEDFAVGFSLNEGIVTAADEITALEVVARPLGIELRMDLPPARESALIARRRHVLGATGCGLCGMESLEAATAPPPKVTGALNVPAPALAQAMAAMAPAQRLNRETHAVHAACFWNPTSGTMVLREDVGRHNALDKLAGGLARAGTQAASGVLLLTSRVSVELVQKAAAMGVSILAAVSVPTALAVRVAETAGITLVAVARTDGFEIFAHPERITAKATEHVA